MPRPIDRHAALVLTLLPLLGMGLYVGFAGPASDHMLAFQVAIAVGSAAWLVAMRLAARGAGSLGLVVVGAIALRLLVLVSDPALSDDVYRTVWEGQLVLEGVSPYAYAPDALPLSELRATQPELYDALNNRDISAAYPPLTQAFGALVVGAAELAGRTGLAAVPWVRAAYALCDLALIVPLSWLLRRRGRPPALVLVWAWCPLVVLEFAGSGHFDSLGILLLVAALALLELPGRLRGTLAYALLAGSILVKYLPLGVLPFALRARGGGPLSFLARLAFVASCVALAFVPLAWLQGGEQGIVAGLSEYGLRWESTNLVYRFVEAALALVLEPDGGWLDLRRVGRLVVGVAWVAWIGVRWRRGDDALSGSAAAIGAFLVLSPTLHPWYLCWMLPFVALRPPPGPALATVGAWVWLVAAAPLLYWPVAGWHARGVWEEPIWLWPVVALPFFALLTFGRLFERGPARR